MPGLFTCRLSGSAAELVIPQQVGESEEIMSGVDHKEMQHQHLIKVRVVTTERAKYGNS